MSHGERMIKRHFKEQLSKSFGSQIDPEKAEELRRTKTDIDNNLTRILKLIKSEDQSKKDENSRKDTELVGLIEDFYNQYQSLYGRLTGEYVKAVPHRLERVQSVSSSSSDSDYFSSEEFDTNTELIDSKQRRRSSFAGALEVLRTQASTEELLATQKEVEILNQQKRTLELQVKSQVHEVKQLGTKNAELHARVVELEFMLKESKRMLKESRGAVCVLQARLKKSDEQTMSKVADLMGRISKLDKEAKSLQIQKGRMGEKIKRIRNEGLSQKKDLTDQLNAMQQNLDSVCDKNKELEAQLERESEKVSQHLVRIENLEDNLAETSSVEECMLKEKECFLARIKDLELEVESRCSKQHDLEQKLRDTRREINRVAYERKAVEDRNHELETAMAQREEDIFALLREQESGASTKAEVDDLRLELETLQDQKSKLELQNEQSQKECSERLAKMENLNVELETQVADQEETIKKLTETVGQIHAENNQARIWSKKFRSYQQFTERKMNEQTEEFRRKMEDNIRILHQRIHVAEQLNNENKDSHKMTRQRYEQENKILGEKVSSYEDEIRTLKASPEEVSLNGLGLEALNGLDLAAGKLEEHREFVLTLVSKMMSEVQFAKDWVKKRNGEMKQLKDKVSHLTALLGNKEEQEVLLREKVWELEANVSKEGGQKLNLMREITQLERKVGKLEKNLKEKDEELVGLGEKKREAIRQLCFLIEFHRDRCVYLKDLMLKTKLHNRNWV